MLIICKPLKLSANPTKKAYPEHSLLQQPLLLRLVSLFRGAIMFDPKVL
jgi:hypothetical protein